MPIDLIPDFAGPLKVFDDLTDIVEEELRAIVAETVERIYAGALRRVRVSRRTRAEDGIHLRDRIARNVSTSGPPRGAIWVERHGQASGMEGWYGTDNRGVWNEFGTGVRTTQTKGEYAGKGRRWAKRRYHRAANRGAMPAQPFMFASAVAESARYEFELQRALNRSVERAMA